MRETPTGGRTYRLFRSFSFRFTLVHAGLFAAFSIALFAFAALTVIGAMTRQVDAAVAGELAEIRADAGSDDVGRIKEVIDGLVAHSPEFFYLLQDSQHRVLAGNMTALRPRNGLIDLERDHALRPDPKGDHPLRGEGVLLPGGAFVFVGTQASALVEMRYSLLLAFLSSLGVIALLALAGGLTMSFVVRRRIETINRAAAAIMSGQLSQRIPLVGSDDEFDHLAINLNAMLTRIEALMTGMRRMSDDIAHDLRTPLSRLRQRLELAAACHSPDASAEQVARAIDQVDAILATFAGLLRISQIEARAPGEGFGPVAISELLLDLADAYEAVAEESGRTITTAVTEGLFVPGDRVLLEQLLVNLIENAIRHTPTGSIVSISATADQETSQIRVTVSDNGHGIPADKHAFVFQRFARLDSSRSAPGSGLGLSVVRAIADHHHIDLRIGENQPGLVVELRFAPVSLMAPEITR